MRAPELQKEIESWLKINAKERRALAQKYYLDIMRAETELEDLIEKNCTDTDNYDEEYNLKRFIKKRGGKVTID